MVEGRVACRTGSLQHGVKNLTQVHGDLIR